MCGYGGLNYISMLVLEKFKLSVLVKFKKLINVAMLVCYWYNTRLIER